MRSPLLFWKNEETLMQHVARMIFAKTQHILFQRFPAKNNKIGMTQQIHAFQRMCVCVFRC